MITTLNKTPNTKSGVSDNKFWFSLPSAAVDLIGYQAIIKRDPITKDFMLSKPDIDSSIKATVISVSRAIRIPIGMVDEEEDLGIYYVDVDTDLECITLIKQ